MAENDQPKPRSGPPRRRRAVTIDLPADKVEASSNNEGQPADKAAESAASPIPVSIAGADEKPSGPSANETASPPSPPAGGVGAGAPPPRSTGGWAMLAGAVMGALVVAIAGYLLMFTDILPAPSGETAEDALAETEHLAAEIEDLRQTIAANPTPNLTPLEERVTALEGVTAGLTDLQVAIDDVQAALTNAEDERGAIADDLLNLEQDVVAVAAAAGDPQAAARLGDNIAALGNRLAALEDAGPGPEITTLQDTIGALQADIAALNAATETLAANAEERDRTADAAQVLAVNNLRFAVDRGDPFTTELGVLTELGVAPETLAALTPIAVTGADSRAGLAAEFNEVAFAILDATNAVEPEAGFWERLFGNARNVVTVRPTTPIEGDTPGAIVSRMQAAIDAGDFATALAEREDLPETGLAASADWADRVTARLTLDTAVNELTATIQQQMGE